jgi:hypothetical protein
LAQVAIGVDYRDSAGGRAINEWILERTGGRFPELFRSGCPTSLVPQAIS